MRLALFDWRRSKAWLVPLSQNKGFYAVGLLMALALATTLLPSALAPQSPAEPQVVNQPLVSQSTEPLDVASHLSDQYNSEMLESPFSSLSLSPSYGGAAVASPTVTPGGRPYTGGATSSIVPILMYHYVRVIPDFSDKLGIGLSVSPSEFERQMRYLVDAGYRTIALEDLALHLRRGTPVPPRSVVLTFDDGYSDFRQEAYPVLKRYGLKATAFIITDFVGRKGYLTWSSVREMADGGMISFGAHTLNHADLTVLPVSVAERQIKESKRVLTQESGTNVTTFAYPSGQYDGATLKMVEAAGFLGAVSTRYGTVHEESDVYRLKRIRVNGRDNLSVFADKLQYVEAPGSVPPFPAVVTPPTTATATRVAITSTATAATVRSKATASPTSAGPPVSTVLPVVTPTLSAVVVVPNVVGLSEVEARARLDRAGLNVGYTNYQQVDDVAIESQKLFLAIPMGHVVSQRPPAGTVLNRGEKVDIAVRK